MADLQSDPMTMSRPPRGDAFAATAQNCPELPKSRADATPQAAEESDDNLTPQQRLAVAAIVSGRSFAAAAGAARCGRRTLFEWRKQPAFRRAVDAQSREALDVVVVRVRNLMLRATRVVGDALLDVHTGRAPVHAMRVINSARCWTILERPGEEMPDDGDASPPTEVPIERAADQADRPPL